MNPYTGIHSNGASRFVVAALLVATTTLGCGPKPGDVPHAPPTDPTHTKPSKTDPTSTLREPIDQRDGGTYFI